jgi:phosphoglycerate dehydrogenase-like enzyme
MLGASCRIDIATCQPYHTVDEHCVGVLGLGGMGTPIARLFADLGFEVVA